MNKEKGPSDDKGVVLSRTLEKEIKNVDEMEVGMKSLEFKSLPTGAKFAVKTKNRTYILERRTDGWYISGHPKYCPEPIKTNTVGSTWGGTSFREGHVGLGMRLEYKFLDPNPDLNHDPIDPLHKTVATTPIVEIGPVTDTPEEKAN